ncbi:forkhead box protein k1 [Plakobranchus ocellatus]|uniref:Forkhead box protein k1 n=1 Tax=Plakobranchus ocellatus TaxID=259542 RepID=A0AAV3Z8W3_9GAST|nr:forkhead box protein k1 [Plakobranchus ocellatus]
MIRTRGRTYKPKSSSYSMSNVFLMAAKQYPKRSCKTNIEKRMIAFMDSDDNNADEDLFNGLLPCILALTDGQKLEFRSQTIQTLHIIKSSGYVAPPEPFHQDRMIGPPMIHFSSPQMVTPNTSSKKDKIAKVNVDRDLSSNDVLGIVDKNVDLDLDQEVESTPKQSATPLLSRTEQKLDLNIAESGDSDNNSRSSSCNDEETDLSEAEEVTGKRIIDLKILRDNISTHLSCKYCHSRLELVESNHQELGRMLQFVSSNLDCDEQSQFPTCPVSTTNSRNYLINRRAAFAMRFTAGSLAELRTFCGLMDKPSPVTHNTYNIIKQSIENVQNDSMAKAAIKEFVTGDQPDDTGLRNCDVSVDGTWMTRGHDSSNIGLTTVIGCTT